MESISEQIIKQVEHNPVGWFWSQVMGLSITRPKSKIVFVTILAGTGYSQFYSSCTNVGFFCKNDRAGNLALNKEKQLD